MDYIAIDLGDKRVWIAQSSQWIAFPLEIVPRTELILYLKKYFATQKQVETLIIGLPYDLYGVDTRQLEKTQKFIKKLQEIFPEKKIIGHDERFSSFEAAQFHKEHRDDIAAQCILSSYLETLK